MIHVDSKLVSYVSVVGQSPRSQEGNKQHWQHC